MHRGQLPPFKTGFSSTTQIHRGLRPHRPMVARPATRLENLQLLYCDPKLEMPSGKLHLSELIAKMNLAKGYWIPPTWPIKLKQRGPICGLNALEAALKYAQPDKLDLPPARKEGRTDLVSIRQVAKAKNFTSFGEIFNVTHLQSLAAHFGNLKTTAIDFSLYPSQFYQEALCTLLRQGKSLIVSVDLDNKSPYPQQSKGLHTHWAQVFGYFYLAHECHFLVNQLGYYFVWSGRDLYESNLNLPAANPRSSYLYYKKTELENELALDPAQHAQLLKKVDPKRHPTLEHFRHRVLAVPTPALQKSIALQGAQGKAQPHFQAQFRSDFVIVANGPFLVREIIAEAIHNKTLVVLDGAVEKIRKLGFKPDIIMGDFDSISEVEARYWGITRRFAQLTPDESAYEGLHGALIIPTLNQEYTDLDKAIYACDQMHATSITLLCASGGRADHHASVIQSLASFSLNDRPLILHTEQQSLTYLKNETQALAGIPGDKCGAIAEEGSCFTLTGFGYDVKDAKNSVCNHILVPGAKIEAKGLVLVIMPPLLDSQREFMQVPEIERLKLLLRDLETPAELTPAPRLTLR